MRVASTHTGTGVLRQDPVSRHAQKSFDNANNVRFSKHLFFLPPSGLRCGASGAPPGVEPSFGYFPYFPGCGQSLTATLLPLLGCRL